MSDAGEAKKENRGGTEADSATPASSKVAEGGGGGDGKTKQPKEGKLGKGEQTDKKNGAESEAKPDEA